MPGVKIIGVFLCFFIAGSVLADGTVPLSNFHQVTNHIWRSARPSYQGLQYLAAQQIDLILDLENDPAVVQQETGWAQQLGVQLISKPMDSFAPVDSNEMNDILSDLAYSQQNILVHCMGGMDRTGLVIGLYRVLIENWPPQQAYNEMLQYGFHPQYQDLDSYFRQRTGWTGP